LNISNPQLPQEAPKRKPRVGGRSLTTHAASPFNARAPSPNETWA
jgi:hypothetical protein